MTHTVASVVASAPADDARFRASSTGRLIRLDLAPDPALPGMFAAHFGPVRGRPNGPVAGSGARPLGDTFRRGSLEYLLHAATEPARLIT
ncbi:hypothetical protein [Streptomyces sp. NBC_00467]|uniref:hypothetical protein n=1 Tax=Streptomyces sp. NBC_00467 TaxID=2975752 RepID=UPI002E17567A